MSRTSSIFNSGHKALIGYLPVGYPDLKTMEKAACVLAENGFDLLELGIPFSDPLADGVTIQRASQRALENGTTTKVCLEVAARLRKQVSIPLLFMTYYNPVLNYGLEAFCQASLDAGVCGFLIPDLPPEEGTELENITRKLDLDLIYFLAPTSSDERIGKVAGRSRGFIYLVSLTGVTGARQELPPGLESFIKRVRKKAAQPLCVGFGISTPEQAKRVAGVADGVIIGSRLIQLIDEDRTLASLKAFTRSLREALH